KYVHQGVPWFTLKAAITLDGKVATSTGDSLYVSGERSRQRVHELRDRVDAVLVGANTVRVDDPRLTTRLPQGRGRDPVRVVLDSRLRLKPTHHVFTQRSRAPTVVVTVLDSSSPRARRLTAQGVQVWSVPARDGHVDLGALMVRMGQEGFLHVLVEGGPTLHASLFRQGIGDELQLFVAPKILGAEGLSWVGDLGITQMGRAVGLEPLQLEQSGEDLWVRALLRARAPAPLRAHPPVEPRRRGS
ncbi:MAG TPA: RibD family protein, partial [Myxococcaceae bacterium]|nr:RibD family protein [Myxococcaceae bacterium]